MLKFAKSPLHGIPLAPLPAIQSAYKRNAVMPTVVLSVGQCGFDDSRLSSLVRDTLGASMDRAHNADDARRKLAEKKYDLVLLNRIFDGDGQSGIAFVTEIRRQDNPPPVILVSDYGDAQQAAVANGAMPGFGKSSLSSPQTAACLKKALSGVTSPT
jgi:DNA-binding NtrC family response regulator